MLLINSSRMIILTNEMVCIQSVSEILFSVSSAKKETIQITGVKRDGKNEKNECKACHNGCYYPVHAIAVYGAGTGDGKRIF